MKKKLLFVMFLALCLALTACGGGKPAAGKVETVGEAPTVPAGTVAPAETLPPETAVPATTAPAENDLSIGRMEGGVYTNEYVGFACTLDSSWTFYSAKELQEIPDTVSDAISGSELAQLMEGVQQFTDMQAENVDAMVTVNVLYQKLSMQERIAYMTMSEEQIVDETLAQRDMLAEAYAQAGMTLLSMDKVQVEFLGQSRYAIHTQLELEGIPYYTLQLVDFHLGEYGVTTTLASFLEDTTSGLLDLFYPLEK